MTDRISAFCMLLLSMLVWHTTIAAPTTFSAEYEVRTRGIRAGHITRSLTVQTGTTDTFVYRTELIPTGIAALFVKKRTTQTAMAMRNDILVAEHFEDYRGSRNNPEKHTVVLFDTLQSTANKQDLYDEHSILARIADDLHTGLLTIGSTATYGTVKNETDYKMRALRIEAEETITVPFGTVTAYKTTITATPNRYTTVWFAKALGFVPIRIEHHEKKDTTIAVLTQYDASAE